ncbi:MAG: leucyl aminopeptidase [Legionellales bacterium]|nr:leucyl aminopeptidase [Legionellales bacterium]
MNITLTKQNPVLLETECLMVAIFENGLLSPAAQLIDQATDGAIKKLIAQGDFTGEMSQIITLYHLPNLKAKRLVLVGFGAQDKLTPALFVKAAQTAFSALVKLPAKNAACFFSEIALDTTDEAARVRFLSQLAEIANNKFDQFKSQKSDKTYLLADLQLAATHDNPIAIAQGKAVANGVNLARLLANMPCNVCTPTYLAEQAIKLSHELTNVSVQVLEKEQLIELKMGCLLAVGQGSAHSPKLIEIHYQGAAAEQTPVVLVGKGITFDTGGISLKSPAGMEDMKFDMAGAASVLGTIKSIAELKLPINVIGLIPTAENMPDGNAYRPGDILTSMSGQTIEVNNTDAEGRLILCDALTYAARFNPHTVIDIATLTGAIVMSLGYLFNGIFSNQNTLAHELIVAGQKSQDLAWHMPLVEEYNEGLKSHYADMTNSCKLAGAITAACFLSRFTKAYRWAHIDCAGSAMPSDMNKAGGATGRPVPLLVEYLINVSTR